MIVAYTGTSDFQGFDKDDFAKAGIEEAKAVNFARGEATEVDDAVGEALIAKDGIFGGHSFAKIELDEGEDLADPETASAADAEAKKKADKAAAKAAKDGGAPSISASGGGSQSDTPAGTSTGAGTSTSTSAPRG